ncbi:hypothetical protein BVG19_g3657 [[Candida] boidinii]|nr:hypothetical protein BVG19_g3657 [[Candida] boidinii]OWB52421.1 hypothetical protein B5S27_g3996 [[Candida] boidinii]OWB85110.1 hypothetical protein B5S33_g3768 [[Candida] boidinii]
MIFNNLLLLATSFLFFQRIANAEGKRWNKAQATVNSCNAVTPLGATFDFVGGKGRNTKICTYAPAMGTLMLCANQTLEADEKLMAQFFENLLDRCPKLTADDLQAQYVNATDNHLPYDPDRNISIPIYLPTLLNPELTSAAIEEYYWFYRNYDMSPIWGGALLAYWGGALLIAAIFNFMRVTGVIKSFNFTWFNYLRQWFTLPTWFANGKHAQDANTWDIVEGVCTMVGITQLLSAIPGIRSIKQKIISGFNSVFAVSPEQKKTFSGKLINFTGLCISSPFTTLLPSRIESIILLGYFIIHFVFFFIDYHIPAQSYIFDSRREYLNRLLADRTGILSFAHIPLLIAFAGRNNILCWVTGFNYASFIQFHKVLASMMFLDAMIHSIAYTIIVLGSYVSRLHRLYFAAGVAATVLGGVVILFALRPFRNYYYEFFLYSHIVLVIGFIAMCWWHCIDLGWMEWIYSSIALWGFDRFIRLIRIFSFGFHKAELEIVSEDTIKVKVKKPLVFKSGPGNYAFAYFLDPLLFWQSHPFTIMNDGQHIYMFIKAKTGLTKRVFNKLQANNNGKKTMWITLEGPYGTVAPAHKYDSTLLITGGSGFPGICDHAIKLSKKDSSKPIKLVWIARNFSNVSFFVKEFSQLVNTNVSVDMYLTRETELDASQLASQFTYQNETEFADDDATSSNEEKDKSSSDNEHSRKLDHINFKFCRPDLNALVDEELSASSSGSLAIVTCGPPLMVDTVRNRIANSVVSYPHRLDLFEEYQVW